MPLLTLAACAPVRQPASEDSAGDSSDGAGDASADGADGAADESGDESDTQAPDMGGIEFGGCTDIDVSLVFDPEAKAYGDNRRAALDAHLDALVQQTDATVRVLVNAGTEFPMKTDCAEMLGEPAGDQVMVWGRDGDVDPMARAALDCTMDAAFEFSDDVNDGDWIFSGLMWPVLFDDVWPTPADELDGPPERRLAIPMLISEDDDKLGNMYSRPGMASESFLRNVVDGQRQQATAFTYGRNADQLELFAFTLGDLSVYGDPQEEDIVDSLERFTPNAVEACLTLEELPPPPVPEGCSKLDLLFVVDGSGSMSDEQKALRGVDGPPVFAEFTDALLQELDGLDSVHVGVISSDPGRSMLHTHRDFPEIPESVETDCGLSPDKRYLELPSDTFAEDFECIAATLAESTTETTMENAGAALNEPQNGDFLRDDSVVLVVMLTDEDTYGDLTRVEQRQAVLEAVDGRLDRLLVLSFNGDQGVFEMPKTTCEGPYGKAVPGRRLTSIVYSYRQQGIVRDLCDGTLGESFESVLDEVVRTCEQYDPEG